MQNKFTKFPSVESFAHVWRNNQRGMFPPTITYGVKIKLHGTNAAVRVNSEGVFAQKRSGDVTPDADNFGFARWVESEKDAWQDTYGIDRVVNDEVVVYHGEWAGPGIQKEDAVSGLKQKYFFVFGVQINDTYITDPETIEQLVPDLDQLVVLPWFMEPSDETVVNFSDRDKAEEFAALISEEAEKIGERDPFIEDIFGVEGHGEGVVLTPFGVTMAGETYVDAMSRDGVSKYMFKVKSEKHRVKKTKAAATVSLKIPDNIVAFVETFVTDARCKQALAEACNGIADRRTTGDFMKWMGNDIRKEGAVEMAEMGYEWKDLAKHVNRASARWYTQRCEVI